MAEKELILKINNKKDSIILLDNVVTQEQYLSDAGEMEPLIENLSFEIMKGSTWGIGASTSDYVWTVCQIISNSRHYYSGKCRIGEIGTPVIKREILDHVFFIDKAEMLQEEMTVLEQMILICSIHDEEKNDIKLQRKVLDLLVAFDLDCLTKLKIRDLYNNEKLLIELLIASMSNPQIIIADFSKFEFTQQQILILCKIVKEIKKKEKTFVIGTMQPKIIGMACDNAIFIHDHKQLFTGTIEELQEHADKVRFVLHTSNAQEIADLIELKGRNITCDVKGNNIYVFDYSENPVDSKRFYALLAFNDIFPDDVKVNKGRVENSFIELVHSYDLRSKKNK